MRQIRFVVVALITSLLVVSTAFWRKAIVFLLCSVLSFNSISCYSFFKQNEDTNASAALLNQINLTNKNTWLAQGANDPESDLCPIKKYTNGRNFIGKSIFADKDFFPILDSIDQAASETKVKVSITSSFRKKGQKVNGAIVKPAKRSNHFVGHAIDVNIQYIDDKGSLQIARSKDLAKRNLPKSVNDFIKKFEKTSIRWGGEFKKRDVIHFDDGYNLNSDQWDRKYDDIMKGCSKKSADAEPKEPCNSPNKLAMASSQSKSEDKPNKNQCIPALAHSSNDPHLVTFDGLKYDLQTIGEVTLIQSSNDDFEVQARQTPYNNSSNLSINSAVAIKVGSDIVALYAQGLPDADTSTPLRVNGEPTAIQEGDNLSFEDGGEILKQGGNYVISAPTGEKVLVHPSSSFLNISPIVDNRAGEYSGLLGNVNGNPKDDLQLRGGKNILEARSTYGDVKQVVNLVGLRLPGVLDRAEQVYFDQLYKEFANSWRVKQEESLFDYPPGKTTKSYLNPGFPDKYLTLNMLSADQIQKAQNACTEAKVTEDLMEGCIFDVGFSGFSEFARATAEISGYIGIVNQLIPGLNIPTPEQAVDRVIEKVKPKVCLPFIGCV